MKTSPCAKLIIRRIPYTSVYPSAISPMMAPCARPMRMKFFHVVVEYRSSAGRVSVLYAPIATTAKITIESTTKMIRRQGRRSSSPSSAPRTCSSVAMAIAGA